MSVTAEQELTSRYCNLWQCRDKLWLVRSEIFLQNLRSRCSILLQYCEKVASALSPTAWQPRRLSLRRKPPHRRAMFSTTTPSMSIWNSKRSTYCQLEPSRAKIFQALETYKKKGSFVTLRLLLDVIKSGSIDVQSFLLTLITVLVLIIASHASDIKN